MQKSLIKLFTTYIEIVADSTDTDFLHLISFVDGICKARKKNTYNCSIRKLPEVLKYLRGIDESNISQTSEKVQAVFKKEMLRRERTNELKMRGTTLTSDFLWPQQLLGVELAECNDRYGFFYDTRTGKTLMSYQIMYNALKAGTARRCIVVCPSAIIQSWLNDAKHFPELKVVAYYGTENQKYEALHTPSHIIIWSMELATKSLDTLLALKFDICFIDESSKLKSHKSQTSQSMLELSAKVPRWYLLSATPAPNNESEYYTQIQTIDPYAFPPARTNFVDKYFTDKSRNKNYEKLVVRPEMKKLLMDKIEEYAIYVDQSVMPVAGKKWVPYPFRLDEDLVQAYDDMRENMCLEVGDKEITAEIAAAMRAKLNQLASGFIMDTDARKLNKISRFYKEEETEKEVYKLSYYRVSALQSLLETYKNEPIIIWANYVAEFEMIQELLGARAKYLRGKTSIKYKEEAIKEFMSGKLQYLVCHPLSVGMGINLTRAHIAIYYSLSDSYEALKQSSERIVAHINIQPHECLFYVMLAEGTVNELIYDNVSNKKDNSLEMLYHLKARFM